jgi:hypothetical protein
MCLTLNSEKNNGATKTQSPKETKNDLKLEMPKIFFTKTDFDLLKRNKTKRVLLCCGEMITLV